MLEYLHVLYHQQCFNRNPVQILTASPDGWERSWSLLFRLPELFGVSELSKSSATIRKDKVQKSLKRSRQFTLNLQVTTTWLVSMTPNVWSSLNLHDISSDAPRLETASSAPHPASTLLTETLLAQGMKRLSSSIHDQFIKKITLFACQQNHKSSKSLGIRNKFSWILGRIFTKKSRGPPWRWAAAPRLVRASAAEPRSPRSRRRSRLEHQSFFDQFNIDLTLTKYKYYSKRLTML